MIDLDSLRIEENLDTIRADVNKEVTTALSEVESLNQNTIKVREEFKEKILRKM